MATTQLNIIKKETKVSDYLKGCYFLNLLVGFDDLYYAKRVSKPSSEALPKPFVQWVGGKREMIPKYLQHLPTSFENYYEPFLGGGAMFFHLKPQNAFLNDLNEELIRTYLGVRDFPNEVIQLLKLLKIKHNKDLYMSIRSIDREIDIFSCLENYEIAARFIYLNQTCFNALYRVNSKGQFNVPIGSSLNRLICDEYNILEASKILKKVSLDMLDFQKFLNPAKSEDFVFIDPPYYPVSEYSDFNRYTKEKFYTDDHIRLKETIDSLTNKKVKVMLSNSDCTFNRELYRDYAIYNVSSNRNLNSDKNKRGSISELLILNY